MSYARTVWALTLLAMLAGGDRAVAAPANQPNVLLMIADDLSWHDIGCWGSPDARTPHIDRLAAQGLKLLGCYSPAPTCSPMRQALYTGLFPVRSGAYPNHAVVKDGTRSLPHYLGELGYRVGLAGKRHFGPAAAYPFEFLADDNAAHDFDYDAIEKFITRDTQQPFCLVAASHEPHEPWNLGDASRFDAAKLTLPPYLVDTPATREALTRYLAEIEFLDGQVGRCLQRLERGGAADNTIVIFVSEQGASLPFAKWTCYNAGIRVAAIVRWPGKVSPGRETGALVQYVDMLPTLIDAAGGLPPIKLDGRSFLPLLLGQTDAHRQYVYALQTTRGIINGSPAYGIRAVSDGRYKYIWNLNHDAEFSNVLTGGKGVFSSWRERAQSDARAAERVAHYLRRPEVEFYDLQTDPYELNNLPPCDEQAATRNRLRAMLETWMEQQGDEGVATELAALEHMAPRARQRFRNEQRGEQR